MILYTAKWSKGGMGCKEKREWSIGNCRAIVKVLATERSEQSYLLAMVVRPPSGKTPGLCANSWTPPRPAELNHWGWSPRFCRNSSGNCYVPQSLRRVSISPSRNKTSSCLESQLMPD